MSDFTVRPDENDDFYEDEAECHECGGEGGYNSCPEDTCCAIGGEEGCSDPVCWKVCPACRATR